MGWVWLSMAPSAFVTLLLCRAQRDSRRQADIRLEEFSHERKCRVVFLLCIRYRAIRGHKQVEIAHIGIVCCEKDTKIPSNSRQNQGLRFQVAEKRLKCSGEKSGMLRLEHKIIIFFWPQ